MLKDTLCLKEAFFYLWDLIFNGKEEFFLYWYQSFIESCLNFSLDLRPGAEENLLAFFIGLS